MISTKEIELIIITGITIFLVIIIYVSCFYPPNSIISNFATRLPIATNFFIGIGIVLTFWIFQNNYQKNITDTTFSLIDRSFLQIFKLLDEKYKECPDFIDSLEYKFGDDDNANNHNIGTNKYMKSDHNQNNYRTKEYISICIFQSVEDYIISSNITNLSDSEWLCTYIVFFSSKQLQEIWNKLRYNMGPKTAKYIEMLINITKNNTFTPFLISNAHFLYNFLLKLYKYIL